MKRGIIILFSIVAMIFGCKKLVKAVFTGADVNAPTVQITIPVIPLTTGSEINLGTYSASFNLDSSVKAKTGGLFGADILTSIKIKQVTITNTNADDLNNLSNFEYVRVALYSDNNPTVINALTINSTDTYASTITVNPTDSPDLLPYLQGSRITYTVYGKNRRPTTKPLDFTINILVRVN
ncbi:hypothetical protein BH09BAC2_BH09BAC2_13980 [soil metagenome]